MLAYSYQQKINPGIRPISQVSGLTQQKSKMRKQLLSLLFLFTVLLSAGWVKAQTITVATSGDNICFGDQLNLDAAVSGGTGTQARIDWENDGVYDVTLPFASSNYSFQTIYSSAGAKTIKIEVSIQGGNPITTTHNVIVYRLPIPSATVIGSPILCFRGNNVQVSNSSIKTDNSIYRIEIDWGDARIDQFPFPQVGAVYNHSYNAASAYNIGIKVVDSIGCFKDTFYNGLITIKQNISPTFNVIGTRNCDTSQYLFVNTTSQVPFGLLRRYTWDFGDGSTDTRQKAWNLPIDQLNYDTIYHNYTTNGIFEPALIIEDSTGCIDSLRILKTSSLNKPENIIVTIDAVPYLVGQDSLGRLRRDSVCFDYEGNSTLLFKQTPNPLINPANGELVWNFGDPPSMNNNFNTSRWDPTHAFVRGLGTYYVTLLLWPNQPSVRCRKLDTIIVEVLGPRSRIEDPQNNIELDPNDKSQCQALASGYYGTVDFVNTSQYYKSEHIFRRWDFGDDFAPQCTSYLVPKPGFPPLGGWATAADQYNNSIGYWRQGNKIFPGRRLDCRFSSDSLPMHNYRDWDVIYKWYRYGHDFMPWDPAPTGRYTRNPADTLLPVNQGGKVWVQDWDTLYWNKPVYLDPVNGTWSLTQGVYNDPQFGPNTPWPRIDTVKSFDENGQETPRDLLPYNQFILQNGAPDPLVGFYGNTIAGQGGYGFIPRGKSIDPLNDTLWMKYIGQNGVSYRHNYDSTFDDGTNNRMTLYRYMFNRGVIRCHTVTLFLKDSANNVGNKSFIVAQDALKLDTLDCKDESNVTLNLMRPDARGLGKSGRECPGPYAPDLAGIEFTLGAVSDRLGDYPGVSPDCGQSWIRINLDSMADRLDGTPCTLDGFINYTGSTALPVQPCVFSTTPGGINYPPFANGPDFGQFNCPGGGLWTRPSGTSLFYHYGPGVSSGFNLIPPAHPMGDVTVGLIIGSGDPANPCLSDTVWYHNFLSFSDIDSRFLLDPTYHPLTNVPTNGTCKYYCKNDMVNFVYLDSTQRNLSFSQIDWGDNSYTVDSFYYSVKPGVTDGYFVDGFRRVRYQIYKGICGQYTDGIIYDSIVFPAGLPGVKIDTVYIDNYTFRIYDPNTNPTGSLTRIGANTAGDSVQWQECGRFFWVANKDTGDIFYLKDIYDHSKMLFPVTHQYWSSSYENGCKSAGTSPKAVRHTIGNRNLCTKASVNSTLTVRGVIDSVRTRNEKGEWDEVFCKNEPVHFYDSVRYFRPDCTLSHPQFNPNYLPNPANKLAQQLQYNPPFSGYYYDTVNYWRAGSVNINDFYPTGEYIEKVKYYFGDGDSAMWTNPVHKYKNAGIYTVTMLSRDLKGCWDTTYCKVYVSEPNSVPVIKPGTYNCGAKVIIWDKSTMTNIPGYTGPAYDSIRYEPNAGSGNFVNHNFWWFGERVTADTADRADAYDVDTAEVNYRRNGLFRIKLVVQTAQGCKDTGFANLYIQGPRPRIKLITDSVGCAPFKIKVVNLADVEGAQSPNDKPTRRTDILWGDANNQFTASLNQYDTLSFTYQDSGTFYIFGRGDDNNPQSDQQGCKIILTPDTIDAAEYPIYVKVKRAYPTQIDVNKQVVCVDQQFIMENKSDTISYTQFKYSILTGDFATQLDSIMKPNNDNRIPYALTDTGTYQIMLIPTAYAPGLPQCPLYDTATIQVVKPYASFDIDSSSAPNFKFTNSSVSAYEYTWTATKNNQVVATVDKVQADRDWSYNFDKDTGDVEICLEAYTQDPAKPICVDKVCKTISYRFVVEMEIFNVFTPNKDGSNDIFDIKIKGETKYDLVVYNRWGNKVFESTNANKDWDGTNQNDGSECPAGTYYYVFKYELVNGEKKTLNGSISLIRQ